MKWKEENTCIFINGGVVLILKIKFFVRIDQEFDLTQFLCNEMQSMNIQPLALIFKKDRYNNVEKCQISKSTAII